MKFRQRQKKLLSLRSNPQTMSPYIQDCDYFTYGSIFVLKIVIT